MQSVTTIAIVAVLSGCVSEVGSVEDTDDESADPSEPVVIAASTDSFACYRPESASSTNGGYSCSGSPNLALSTLCKEGSAGSYHVSIASGADMTMAVIAPHGGKIEPNTDTIALGLAAELDLPHYVFFAHATTSCLDRYSPTDRSNHEALHVTSTHFNDTRAESLMRNVNRGVSIHGHGRSNKICVGGITPALRTAFKSYYDTYARQYSPSGTRAVIATNDAECDDIAGTSRWNISNRSRAGAGLQLELSRTIRNELVASKNSDRLFWTAFRNAVRAACRTSLDGVRGCGG